MGVVADARRRTKELGGAWHGSHGMACCPAHDDRSPSLSITAGRKAVLYHCFAGCSQDDIIDALRGAKLPALKSEESRVRDDDRETRNFADLARHIWSSALPVRDTPAGKYLVRRGLPLTGPCRFDPAAVTYVRKDGGDKRQRLVGPALVLPLHNEEEMTAIQRVFLDSTGNKAKLPEPKKLLGKRSGGAIRIGLPDNGTLNLAEGYEDAQSAIEYVDLSHCWAVCGIECYASIDIPASIRRIVVYSQHGSEAAAALRRADEHLRGGGRELVIILPPEGGDWNDALLSRKAGQ